MPYSDNPGTKLWAAVWGCFSSLHTNGTLMDVQSSAHPLSSFHSWLWSHLKKKYSIVDVTLNEKISSWGKKKTNGLVPSKSPEFPQNVPGTKPKMTEMETQSKDLCAAQPTLLPDINQASYKMKFNSSPLAGVRSGERKQRTLGVFPGDAKHGHPGKTLHYVGKWDKFQRGQGHRKVSSCPNGHHSTAGTRSRKVELESWHLRWTLEWVSAAWVVWVVKQRGHRGRELSLEKLEMPALFSKTIHPF